MAQEKLQLQALHCLYYLCILTPVSVCEGLRRYTFPQKAEAATTRKSSVSRTWGAAAAEAARIGWYTKQLSRNAPQAGIHQRYQVCKTAVYNSDIKKDIQNRYQEMLLKQAIAVLHILAKKGKQWGPAGNVGQRSKMSNMRAALLEVYRLLALSSQDDNWRCWKFVLFHGLRVFIGISQLNFCACGSHTAPQPQVCP
jgi:hypothetical protein